MAKRPNTNIDPFILKAALDGLAIQKKHIEEQIKEIQALLGKFSSTISNEPVAGKRTLSVEARKRIATAQKKRWAEYRKSNARSK